MSSRTYLLSLCAMSLLSLLFFHYSQRALRDPWEQLALAPEMQDALVNTMKYQRTLARLDGDNAETYKAEFDKTQALLAHLEILGDHRESISRRYNLVLLCLLALALALLVALSLWRRNHLEARLELLRGDLERLARGETDLKVGVSGNDVVGRIADMVRTTSTVMARNAQRLKALENLESWQESSRRMAHEIRTPLTALRLEVDKLVKLCIKHAPELGDSLQQQERGVREELGHLASFTDQYTSFAKIGTPNPKPVMLQGFLDEFAELYAQAWPNLTLRFEHGHAAQCTISLDRRLIRQVLVNLCNNSSQAIGEEQGEVTFQSFRAEQRLVLRVADNGPGIEPVMRRRLFQPYTTTKPVGEGTGLGLAISRKVMLDHGGDLELETDSEHAAFLLSFPIDDLREEPHGNDMGR